MKIKKYRFLIQTEDVTTSWRIKVNSDEELVCEIQKLIDRVREIPKAQILKIEVTAAN